MTPSTTAHQLTMSNGDGHSVTCSSPTLLALALALVLEPTQAFLYSLRVTASTTVHKIHPANNQVTQNTARSQCEDSESPSLRISTLRLISRVTSEKHQRPRQVKTGQQTEKHSSARISKKIDESATSNVQRDGDGDIQRIQERRSLVQTLNESRRVARLCDAQGARWIMDHGRQSCMYELVSDQDTHRTSQRLMINQPNIKSKIFRITYSTCWRRANLCQTQCTTICNGIEDQTSYFIKLHSNFHCLIVGLEFRPHLHHSVFFRTTKLCYINDSPRPRPQLKPRTPMREKLDYGL